VHAQDLLLKYETKAKPVLIVDSCHSGAWVDAPAGLAEVFNLENAHDTVFLLFSIFRYDIVSPQQLHQVTAVRQANELASDGVEGGLFTQVICTHKTHAYPHLPPPAPPPVHTHSHTYTHANIHTREHTHTYTYTHIHTHTHTHIHSHTDTHTHTHTHIKALTLVRTHAHTCVSARTHGIYLSHTDKEK
jgi:hypothetical protein